MSEQPLTGPDAVQKFQVDLVEAARLMREADHIDPEQQEAMAELVAELGHALDPDTPPEYTNHLAECSGHLVQALRERHDEGVLSAARTRMEEAAARAEADAPMVTNIVRRMLNVLSDLGI